MAGKYRGRADGAIAALRGFYNPATGLWPSTGWWNAANALETTVDYAIRTGSNAYRDVVINTFTKNSAGHFLNDFYDDEGWWALAWIKAYDWLGDPAYLAAAKTIFTDMTGGWDQTCGGGIWWNKPHAKKNAIANELFLSVAARLHLRTPGDGGSGSYLDWAQRTWSWFEQSGLLNASNLVNDGLTAACVNDGGVTWTYNQGVILGGLVALAQATGDASLTARAQAIANAAIAGLSDASGILHEPGEPNLGVDGPQFKGIFVRNLAELFGATSDPAYRTFFLANANAIWSLNRAGGCNLGGCWAGPFDKADASRQSAALDALNVALLFDVDGVTYQAEDGILHGIGVESIHAGFNGKGYLAGWDLPGQGVDIAVNVSTAGPYDITLRYAAYDNASRCISVNQTVVEPNFSFPKTGTWDQWTTATLYDVILATGANTISVTFDGTRGNTNWLNLDEITVS
jgi:predicted alpha-1,6-mannanase (GH76 family)